MNNYISKYDETISLGGSCLTGMMLRKYNIKKETYPFDWVRSTPEIIYDILLNGYEKYILFNKNVSHNRYLSNFYITSHIRRDNFPITHINGYGQYFTHYTNITSSELKDKYKRYCERFLNKLKTSKSILFIYSTESYIFVKNLEDKKYIFYNFLKKISEHIEKNYPNLSFKIINIQHNNTHQNTEHIINFNFKPKNKRIRQKYHIYIQKIFENHLL